MNKRLSEAAFIVFGPEFRPGVRPGWCCVKYKFDPGKSYLDNHFLMIDDNDGCYSATRCLHWPRRLRHAADNNHYLSGCNDNVRLYQSTCMNCVYYTGKFGYSPKAVMHYAEHLVNEKIYG